MKNDQPPPLWPSIWKVACVATIGAFMAQIDATVVNVSLASLGRELHASLATIQWVTSGYLLALALTLPLNGWLVDRIGTKAMYLWCFGVFTLASALCGLARSPSSLIAFRVLQGMAGGLLAPMAQMTMARAAGKRMAEVISIVALPVLLAPLLGPVLAGAILSVLSWRWLFLVNLPVGVVAMAMTFAFLPRDGGETKPRRLDLTGLALLSPGLVMFLYGSDNLAKPIGVAALALAVAMLVLFWVVAARKGDAALIDLRLLKNKVFSAAMAIMFLVNGASFAGQMLVPIWLIRGAGRSPTAAGWLMAPLGLGLMCAYPFIGRLNTRFGAHRLATTGSLLALIGLAPLLYLPSHGLNLPLLAISLFVRGLGMSAVGLPALSAGYAATARADIPMATSAMNIVQRLGGPTMTTACATLLGWRLAAGAGPASTAAAFTAAFGLLWALHGAVWVATWRLPGRKDDGGIRDEGGGSSLSAPKHQTPL